MSRTLETILHRVTLREMVPTEAATVTSGATLGEVHAALGRDAHGAIVICDEERRPLGIFTERDVLYRTALEDLDPETPIERLMTSDVKTLSPDDHVADAVTAMTRGGLRHIPVVDADGRLGGMVSSRTVLRFLARFYPQSVLNLPPRLNQRMARSEGG